MRLTSAWHALHSRLVRAAVLAEPRGLQQGIGRSLLALAQLSTVVFSESTALFSPVLRPPDGVRCDGIRAISLWCATEGMGASLLIGRTVTIAVLLVVLSGYRPRLSCVPHWYVAFSMVVSTPESDGGDRVLMLATMLLIPLCLGDDRTWHWTGPDSPMPAAWRGVAYAGHHALRLQLSIVYLGAALSKAGDPLWRRGSAMVAVAYHPYAGFPPFLRDLIDPLLHVHWIVASASWSVIAVQLALAVLFWCGDGARRWALVLGIGFHAGIMVLMSLSAFGLVLIGVVVLVCSPIRSAEDEVVTRNERVRGGSSVRGGAGDSG
ncbi:sporulation-delaying protein SdpB family protein [Lentzea sp. NPDC058450]|uniref:sporulation-delaying protein SdpB family protein n=1 Tax=Lentzea sp. NPDC058450 TaxID=3346505 RepID=UPI003646FC96